MHAQSAHTQVKYVYVNIYRRNTSSGDICKVDQLNLIIHSDSSIVYVKKNYYAYLVHGSIK